MPTYLFHIPADTAHFKHFFMLGEYFTICAFHNSFNHSTVIDVWVASKWASLVAQIVKNPPAMQKTWVQSLGWEDPLEKGMATHATIIAWRIPWIEEPGRLQSMELQRVGHDWATIFFIVHNLFSHSTVIDIWVVSKFLPLQTLSSFVNMSIHTCASISEGWNSRSGTAGIKGMLQFLKSLSFQYFSQNVVQKYLRWWKYLGNMLFCLITF